ncbi:hypothetical protein O3P69_017482 [Scylla paramamosain]|uniref:NADPH-dependent FMN reductase-like domain-containing protein n=1 Tax=Scylla paramamosain TaxID=85552 RepID=A0AAW0TZ36_SCYPA
MSLKFLVFLGSTREGRLGENVAKCVVKKLQALSHQAEMIDPLSLEMDGHLRQPLHFRPDQSQAPEWMKETNGKIQAADGLVVVTPEYNCALPPALTATMDQFPPASYKHKPCGIVSYSVGSFAGVRAAALARPFLSELGMISVPQGCSISEVQGKFTEEGECSDERTDKRLAKLVNELVWYGSAIASKKEKDGLPE